MCIYQILGLFNSTTEQARLAESQQSFFLKMTRRLAQQFLPLDQESTPDPIDATWRRWILLESLRRTLFLVNIINNLGCRTQKLNGFYYEPLGDQMILDLPVPAPQRLWDATSAEEWSSIFENFSEDERILVNTSVGRLKQMVDPTATATGKASNPAMNFDKLSEFTKLVLASLIVEIPDD
jgi:hypothetical protein